MAARWITVNSDREGGGVIGVNTDHVSWARAKPDDPTKSELFMVNMTPKDLPLVVNMTLAQLKIEMTTNAF